MLLFIIGNWSNERTNNALISPLMLLELNKWKIELDFETENQDKETQNNIKKLKIKQIRLVKVKSLEIIIFSQQVKDFGEQTWSCLQDTKNTLQISKECEWSGPLSTLKS